MFVAEFIVTGLTVLGCACAWVAGRNHKLNVELQKHKITTDYESIKPLPEPSPPKPVPSPDQLALDALLFRRNELEVNITQLRLKSCEYSNYGADKKYELLREDAAKALADAREEQQEIAIEQENLLNSMREANEARLDSSRKSIRIDTKRADEVKEFEETLINSEIKPHVR